MADIDHDTMELAAMVLSDCGISTATSDRLQQRVAERIQRHIDGQAPAGSGEAAKQCYLCGGTGHDSKDCRLMQSQNGFPVSQQPAPDGESVHTPPFSNCKFDLCDLPGQCRSEGKCHHPDGAPKNYKKHAEWLEHENAVLRQKLAAPDGEAVAWVNPDLGHMAEEAECVSMALDDRGVPKLDGRHSLSLWGRVEQYAKPRFIEGTTTNEPRISREHIEDLARLCGIIKRHTTAEWVDLVVRFVWVVLCDKSVQEKFVMANAHLLYPRPAPANLLVEALEVAKIGLRDWELPESRYKALNVINAALAAAGKE